MQPFREDLSDVTIPVGYRQALLPLLNNVELDLSSRWERSSEQQFIDELERDLLRYFGAVPFQNKRSYYLVITEQDAPFAVALMQKNVIALSSRFIDLLNFMSTHIFLQRQITLYQKQIQATEDSAISQTIEMLNQQMPLYYTAISSAIAEGRIRDTQKFRNFLADLQSRTTSGNCFQRARAWLGFTLLHEIGHYVYSEDQEFGSQRSKTEELFCDRFALKEMIPNLSAHPEQSKELYSKFIDFVGSILVFFTHSWLTDYGSRADGMYPTTFERTAQLIDLVNVDGAWTDLRNNLQSNHWKAVQTVIELDTEKKAVSSAGLHEAISAKMDHYSLIYQLLSEITTIRH